MHHNILRVKQSSSTKIQPSNTFCDIRLQPRDVDNYASTSACYDCNVVTFKDQKKFFALHVVTAGPEHLAVDCQDFPKSSLDPHCPVRILYRTVQRAHCPVRILIGRIFCPFQPSPFFEDFCNHVCRKLTVMRKSLFAGTLMERCSFFF